MELANVAVVSCNILAASSQCSLHTRDLYVLEKRAYEAYPLIYRNYSKRYLKRSSRFAYTHNVTVFLNTLLSLGLPSGPLLVVDELDELSFREGNYQNKSLRSLNNFGREISQEIARDLMFHETVSLLKLRDGEGNSIGVDEIDADDNFKNFLAFQGALDPPVLEKLKKAISQGVSLEILKKLVLGRVAVFLDNANLNLWRGPLGDLLLEYALFEFIKCYDSFTLNYLENSVVAQGWIMRAKLENFPVETIILMLEFPERAEYIYRTPKSKVLEGIFMGRVSSWRQDFISMVDWSQFKWKNCAREKIIMTPLLLPLKEDLLLSELIRLSYHCSHICGQIFGSSNTHRELVKDYTYRSFVSEHQVLIYLHLKNKGYPIQDIFITPNDELESQIWEHFEAHGEGMNWLKFKASKIIRDKLSISYSQAAFGGVDLVNEYLRRSADEINDLLSTLNIELNEYLGEDVKLHFEKDCIRDGHSCACVSFEGRPFERFDGFKRAYLHGINVYKFYPKMIRKLKDGCGGLASRGLLLDILRDIVQKKLGFGYIKVIDRLSYADILYSIKGGGIESQAWSDDIRDLAANIRRLYLLYHPQVIFKHVRFDDIIRADEKFLGVSIPNPNGKIYL